MLLQCKPGVPETVALTTVVREGSSGSNQEGEPQERGSGKSDGLVGEII